MTTGTLLLMGQVLLAATVIVAAGTVLARMGDVVAARTRMGGAWVGAVFLAGATSLPEIATDVSAVWFGAPDLAVGDLFGSSMANMVILAVITLAPAGADVFRKATLDHALYASLAIVLTAVAALGLVGRPVPALGGIGAASIALLAIYVAGSRTAFRHSAVARRATKEVEMTSAPEGARDAAPSIAAMPLSGVIVRFVGAALVLLVASPLFASRTQALALATGVGNTFLGTWLVGLATSLPELVTSLAAVRMRAYDLAVGNLFGSNAFNMAVFPLLDAVRGAPVLNVADPAHVISALVGIALMGIALGALVYRARGRLSLLEPGAGLILLTYVLGLVLVLVRSR